MSPYKEEFAGYKRTPYWDDNAPIEWRQLEPGGPTPPPWLDHLCRLTKEGEETIYVTEPYHLDGECCEELGKISRDGWDVLIDMENSIHNPGEALPIWITKEKVD